MSKGSITKPGCKLVLHRCYPVLLSISDSKLFTFEDKNCTVIVVSSPTLAVISLLAPCLLHSPLHLLVFYNRTKWRCYFTVLLFLLLCFVTLTLSSFRGHCKLNNPMRSQVNMQFIMREKQLQVTCVVYMWNVLCVAGQWRFLRLARIAPSLDCQALL